MKINIYKQIISFCLLSFVFCILSSLPVKASSSITVFPSIVSLVLSPGKTSLTTLTIGNNSQTPLPVRIYFEPLILADDPSSLPSIGSWITLSRSSLLIPANTQEKINIQITIPKTVAFGGYYGMLYVEPLTSVRQLNGSQILTKMGVLLLGSVGVQDVPLNQIELNKPILNTFISESNTFTLSYSIKNNSLNHISAKPYLIVHPLSGKEETVLFDERLVFPGKTRTWQSEFNVNDGKKIVYTADLFVSIGNGLSHKKSFTFIIFPIKLTIILVLCIAIGISIIRKRKQIKKAVEILVNG
jgi:hypothetical protein